MDLDRSLRQCAQRRTATMIATRMLSAIRSERSQRPRAQARLRTKRPAYQARPAPCADTAKAVIQVSSQRLFLTTFRPTTSSWPPTPSTSVVLPARNAKNYRKRPATDVHCCASSTSPSLTAPSSASCDPGRRDAKLLRGSACPQRGRWGGRRRSQGLPGPRPPYRSCRDHQWRRRRAPVPASAGSIRRRPTSRPSSYIRSIA